MKHWKRLALPAIILVSMFLGSLQVPWVWAAISNISGMAVQGSSIQWNNLKDGSQGDALTNGVAAGAMYGYNGATFDRLRSDTTNGLQVNVKALAGAVTPADAYANPTTAIQSWSLLGGFNGTTWDRLRSTTANGLAVDVTRVQGSVATTTTGAVTPADAYANPTTATQSWSLLGGFNGTTWDRLRSDTTNGLQVNVKAVPTAGTAFYSIKRTNIDNSASVNLAFGFTSKKVQIETAPANTQEIIVDWIGGTAVAPAANTAGDDRIAAGRIITLDTYGVASISLIGVDNTSQTVYVRAWQ